VEQQNQDSLPDRGTEIKYERVEVEVEVVQVAAGFIRILQFLVSN
jgi:hypothetical protein